VLTGKNPRIRAIRQKKFCARRRIQSAGRIVRSTAEDNPMAGNNHHQAMLRRLLREAPVTAERVTKAFGSMSISRWVTVAVLLGLLALVA
jgi:hypothetical protein